MKFTIERSHLIKQIKQVSVSLGGLPNLTILGNLLIKVDENVL
ncbi:DNA polymerase III subunit beta, partial [Vibrio parahaemolyticus]|nr:DNA polymerase III subunit beta [Vibrio parahaemolyticus]